MNRGSSPREWGTRSTAAIAGGIYRFIPTRVGNTVSWLTIATASTVHPHASGEHASYLITSFIDCGSSPREWGTHVSCHNPYAVTAGSSPREWGTRQRVSAEKRYPRFIPTRVGNTPEVTPAATARPVHPHASGEHRNVSPELPAHIGSSPREWGTLPISGQRDVGIRFIPTRVGNTSPSLRIEARNAVHPHASGEHASTTSRFLSMRGSSPREWGTHLRDQLVVYPLRFIPTRVGNTTRRTSSTVQFGVHPHASGEHVSRRRLSVV